MKCMAVILLAAIVPCVPVAFAAHSRAQRTNEHVDAQPPITEQFLLIM